MKYRTNSAIVTKKLGVLLGKEILKRSARGPLVFALQGDLGAGKTTFIQGFAKGLGVRRLLTSPTFVLMRIYPLNHPRFKKLFHIDAYRIKKQKDLSVLGVGEILSVPSHIILIEWAERMKKLLPRRTVWISFEHGRNENERTIKI